MKGYKDIFQSKLEEHNMSLDEFLDLKDLWLSNLSAEEKYELVRKEYSKDEKDTCAE